MRHKEHTIVEDERADFAVMLPPASVAVGRSDDGKFIVKDPAFGVDIGMAAEHRADAIGEFARELGIAREMHPAEFLNGCDQRRKSRRSRRA